MGRVACGLFGVWVVWCFGCQVCLCCLVCGLFGVCAVCCVCCLVCCCVVCEFVISLIFVLSFWMFVMCSSKLSKVEPFLVVNLNTPYNTISRNIYMVPTQNFSRSKQPCLARVINGVSVLDG